MRITRGSQQDQQPEHKLTPDKMQNYFKISVRKGT